MQKSSPFRVLRAAPVLVAIFLFMLALVYCITWRNQAEHARENMIVMIAAINGTQPKISYSDIKTGGFPLDVNVYIMQPKWSSQNTPDEKEEISLNGSIMFGVNLFSNRFTAASSGTLMHTVTATGGVTSTMVTESPGPSACVLGVESHGGLFGPLWDMQRLARLKPEEINANLQLLDCSGPGYRMTDPATHEILLASGPFSMRFSNLRAAGGGRNIDATLRLADFQTSPRLNPFFNQYIATAYKLPSVPDMNMSAFGKQNMDIAFSLHGTPGAGDTPFSLSMPRFIISTAMYSMSGDLLLENKVAGNSRTLTLALNFDENVSKEYDDYITAHIPVLLQQVNAINDPALLPFKNWLATLPPEQAAEKIAAVLPQLHSFGAIGLRTNLSMQGDRTLRNGSLTVNTLALSTAPYGLLLRGNSALAQASGHAPANANFTLTCRNCLMMVDDLAHYAQRVQQTFAPPADAQAASPQIMPPQLVQGIQAFMATLGEKHRDQATGADLLLFTLSTDGAGNVSMNGKSPPQVKQIFDASIAPYLPAPVPAQMPAPAATPPGNTQAK